MNRSEAARVAGLASRGQYTELSDDVGYSAVHYRARKVLPKRCEMEDETCSGTLHAALRVDAPGPIRFSEGEGPYSLAPSEQAYIRLCVSHHHRYDPRWRENRDWSASAQKYWDELTPEDRQKRSEAVRQSRAQRGPAPDPQDRLDAEFLRLYAEASAQPVLVPVLGQLVRLWSQRTAETAETDESD